LTCALGTLARDGGTASVHVTVHANAAPGTLITNTASVSAHLPDINPADNTDSVTTTISNAPPVASNFVIATYQGMAVTGVLPAVDPNGDALTFSILTDGVKGTALVTDAATGAFTYTPSEDQIGSDNFTFRASDGVAYSNVATVTVTLQPLPA